MVCMGHILTVHLLKDSWADSRHQFSIWQIVNKTAMNIFVEDIGPFSAYKNGSLK